jgi:hypothetical protein
MGVRTVRLDQEAEKMLFIVMQETGMSISAAVKKGLRLLEENLPKQKHSPYEIYQQLNIGRGNPRAPHARDAQKVLREAFKQKLAQKRSK